ncbi:hypothetical protein Nepgr_012084 [Nepenthes gracilis]|uniref:Uncharacterized protein n=1 Tax=Nepenthes gracilis TaxID=150966 RepID=A0AAD3XMM6_NEPGR|nr:hypothetical protein Nepgr_012084 [Nepenthes gracilis]
MVLENLMAEHHQAYMLPKPRTNNGLVDMVFLSRNEGAEDSKEGRNECIVSKFECPAHEQNPPTPNAEADRRHGTSLFLMMVLGLSNTWIMLLMFQCTLFIAKRSILMKQMGDMMGISGGSAAD